MKLLWVKTDFLHPPSRGGRIRTLETLKRLKARHEVHYVAYHDGSEPEALERSHEYCSFAYPVPHRIPSRRSLVFLGQALGNLASTLPFAVSRYVSGAMRQQIARLRRQHRFDAVVCDFLAPAPNFPSLEDCILFQHNVETMIWQRHAAHAPGPLQRAYFQLQARRMFACERKACQQARRIIAVSESDAQWMRQHFGATRIDVIPTGVDVDYFARPPAVLPVADLAFVGSMDWMPNIDGMEYFVQQILPLIRARRPACRLVIVGRNPSPSIRALAERDPQIQVTGTVADVRPYLWGSKVSIVPLRIGGGTRLKIYEALAAGTPVVSTQVGAEGLEVTDGEHIRLADSPEEFAAACLELLENPALAQSLATRGRQLVCSRFSWDYVASEFEAILARVADPSLAVPS